VGTPRQNKIGEPKKSLSRGDWGKNRYLKKGGKKKGKQKVSVSDRRCREPKRGGGEGRKVNISRQEKRRKGEERETTALAKEKGSLIIQGSINENIREKGVGDTKKKRP